MPLARLCSAQPCAWIAPRVAPRTPPAPSATPTPLTPAACPHLVEDVVAALPGLLVHHTRLLQQVGVDERAADVAAVEVDLCRPRRRQAGGSNWLTEQR